MSKKCPKCYTLNVNDTKYCMNCGMELPQGNPQSNQQVNQPVNPQINQQPPNNNNKTTVKDFWSEAVITRES